MSRRMLVSLAIGAALALGIGVLVPKAIAAQHQTQATWQEPQSVAPAEVPQEAPPAGTGGEAPVDMVSVAFTGDYLGWSMEDRNTGAVTGENMDETSTTESMIKTWLVADFLRLTAKPSAYQLGQAEEAIRWSDDSAAQWFYERDGEEKAIQRMIDICGLTETEAYESWWSRTTMSPRDAVRLGECIADGRAAGPQWTDWLLDTMRNVTGSTAPADQEDSRGGGRWGIIDGVPATQAAQVAIKNGWTSYEEDGWHVNCLAIGDTWTMAVMMRYPSDLGLDYGAGICRSIATQLLT